MKLRRYKCVTCGAPVKEVGGAFVCRYCGTAHHGAQESVESPPPPGVEELAETAPNAPECGETSMVGLYMWLALVGLIMSPAVVAIAGAFGSLFKLPTVLVWIIACTTILVVGASCSKE